MSVEMYHHNIKYFLIFVSLMKHGNVIYWPRLKLTQDCNQCINTYFIFSEQIFLMSALKIFVSKTFCKQYSGKSMLSIYLLVIKTAFLVCGPMIFEANSTKCTVF